MHCIRDLLLPSSEKLLGTPEVPKMYSPPSHMNGGFH